MFLRESKRGYFGVQSVAQALQPTALTGLHTDNSLRIADTKIGNVRLDETYRALVDTHPVGSKKYSS